MEGSYKLSQSGTSVVVCSLSNWVKQAAQNANSVRQRFNGLYLPIEKNRGERKKKERRLVCDDITTWYSCQRQKKKKICLGTRSPRLYVSTDSVQDRV